MDASRIVVSPADPHLPECVRLVEHLWQEEGRIYGDTGPCRFTPDQVAGERTVFVIARIEGEPVGCGAVRPLADGVGEVKRMFVEPAARRRGVARQVLRTLEETARGLGFHSLRLETGVRQPEAIRLYERAGYLRIPCYGVHADDPLSVCFEKRLDVPQGAAEHAAPSAGD